MTDAYVQVATDGAGKKIDNSTHTREKPDPARESTAGDTVYRQRVVLSSDENLSTHAEVSGEAGKGKLHIENEAAKQMVFLLTEIRNMLELILK